jgi:L-ascorbate metabolism protein UlaG (beta-lactamase superfamily)
MPLKIEYLGWATFRFVTEDGTKIVLDPFLEGDSSRRIPPSVASVKDLSDTQVVMVTHAAGDHAAQAIELLTTSGATFFGPRDVGIKAVRAGIPAGRVFNMVPGIRFNFLDIQIKALWANHQSLTEFEGHWITGVPLSFIVDLGAGGKIFCSGDSALGMHYRFFGEFYQPDLAILGIGGVYRNGQYLTELPPYEAAVATQWLKVKAVIPMHYLGNEAEEFRKELSQHAPDVDLAIMKPGERLFFSSAQGLMR